MMVLVRKTLFKSGKQIMELWLLINKFLTKQIKSPSKTYPNKQTICADHTDKWMIV